MTFAIFLICAAACSNTTGGGTTESPAAGGTTESPAAGGETELNYPDGPITMLVGYSAGGGSDMACRTFADPFSQQLGEAVTISNMEGGSGTVAVNELLNSDPDVPTLTELGYENCSMASYCGLAVLKGLDPEILSLLREKFDIVAQDEEFQTKLYEVAKMLPAPMTADEYYEVISTTYAENQATFEATGSLA